MDRRRRALVGTPGRRRPGLGPRPPRRVGPRHLDRRRAVRRRPCRAAAEGPPAQEGLSVHLLGRRPPRTTASYYDVISNETLWFVHHGLFDLTRSPAVRRATGGTRGPPTAGSTRRFADAVCEHAPEDAAVLVQDYHLTLAGPDGAGPSGPTCGWCTSTTRPSPVRTTLRVLPPGRPGRDARVARRPPRLRVPHHGVGAELRARLAGTGAADGTRGTATFASSRQQRRRRPGAAAASPACDRRPGRARRPSSATAG